MDRELEVRVARRIGTHHEQLPGHTLQDLDLSNDDGASLDHEATFILAGKATGTSARHDCGSRRRRAHELIMTEVHLGRLVAASLHQAITEELPQRLDFYENWLHPEGLRDGSIGLAPMQAVLGFLRTEGEGYERVVARAGDLAAEWTLMSYSPLRHRLIGWCPRSLRIRAALQVASSVVGSVSSQSRLSSRVRGTTARLKLLSSVFCSVRGIQVSPLCGFYLALVVRTLGHFGIAATARVEGCRAMGAANCVFVISLDVAQPVAEPAVAA
jgi:hypothetical protein